MDRALAEWLDDAAATDPGTIADVGRVRTLLIAAAGEGRALSYSELLAALGHRFTRPKMRALCRTLDRIDADARAAGEPALAVLVVRESDRLPGQGWWTGAAARGHAGPWSGPAAQAHVAAAQQRAFARWATAAPHRRWSGGEQEASMDGSKGAVVERIARVLAGQRLSANAGGDSASAAAAVDRSWPEHRDDALAVLRTLREPDAAMAAAGDAAVWERMILAALDTSR